MITKAIITKRADGYLTVEYRNEDGQWICRHSSYNYVDIENSLRSIKDKFGEIEVNYGNSGIGNTLSTAG